ncbi:MAG: hypothetical protein K4571_13195 [Deltaproteobacteria bacterium]
MDIQNPIFLQLIIDFALLVAVIFVLWRVNSNLRKPLLKSHQDMMKELKLIMKESQASSDNFLKALEQSRLALKELALELDLKEKRVKTILAKSDALADTSGGKRAPGTPQDKYTQVVDMIRKGYSEAQTAETTGFTEAEIGLIVDLYRVKKNENA